VLSGAARIRVFMDFLLERVGRDPIWEETTNVSEGRKAAIKNSVSKPEPDNPYQASLQAGTLPNFSNKKSINILTLTVSTFDFG
jgi:hypothetical protein